MDDIEIFLKELKIDRTNPDWQIEEFWLTFKDQFYELLDKDEKKKVDEISSHLNELQRTKKYKQIQQYIVEQFDKIAIRVLKARNHHINHSILSYFNRWDRISNYKFNKDNINYQLLKANDLLNYKKITESEKIFQQLIYKYIDSNKPEEVINEMVLHCIKFQNWHHLQRIRSGIPNLKVYLKPDTPEKILEVTNIISISKLKNYFI